VHVTLIRFLVKSDRSVFSFYGLWKAASPSQPYWHWRLWDGRQTQNPVLRSH